MNHLNPNQCDVCGHPMPANEVIIDGDNLICKQCFQHMNTCVLCDNGERCEFKQNPSPIPHTIRKEVRQGNMIAVTDVMNPERVEKTCKSLCGCFSEEFGCLRQFNTCGDFKFTYGKRKHYGRV